MLEPSATRTRLLILDDDLLTGQTLQRIAESVGVEATCLTDPNAFLAAVERGEADIVALDLIMPEMDGVEVMRLLAQRNCRAKLIITSGVGSRILDAASRSAREHGLELIGVLAKPFSVESLRSLLREAMANNAAQSHPEELRDSFSKISSEELRLAIANGEIRIALQPKVHCRTGTLAGFEALARWQHAKLGAIRPDSFIPIAESSGLINSLTLCVLEQGLRWLQQISTAHSGWESAPQSLQHTVLSLNISARSLSEEEFFNEILRRCQQAGIQPSRIAFELTETSAMEDTKLSLDTLTRLRLQGFSLSIDDFGTGYSSMVQLVRLPFSELKVDKSFVMSALASEESRVVVQSVIELGRSLGLRTTAEGVEDEATLQFLREARCDLIQGYFIAKPLPPDAVLAWCREWYAKQEENRLTSLLNLSILDTPPEPRFDRYTRLAAELFQVPTALISLVDGDRQWFKSRVGLEATETPRSMAFCSYAIEQDDLFIVNDASAHPDFYNNPLVVNEPFVRFYAGHPLVLPNGAKIGTLCLIHQEPRAFTDVEQQHLRALGSLVEEEMAELLATNQHHGSKPNRRSFREQVARGLGFGARFQLPAALLAVRVVNIASLNREMGYEVGDQVLEQLAVQIRRLESHAFTIGQRRSSEHAAFLLGQDAEQVMSLGATLSGQLRAWLETEFARSCSPQLMLTIAAVDESVDVPLELLLERAVVREIAL